MEALVASSAREVLDVLAKSCLDVQDALKHVKNRQLLRLLHGKFPVEYGLYGGFQRGPRLFDWTTREISCVDTPRWFVGYLEKTCP